jgi:hypothetical protein
MPDLKRKWPRQEKGGAGAKTQQEGPGQCCPPREYGGLGAGLKHLMSMTVVHTKSSHSFINEAWDSRYPAVINDLEEV